MKTWKRVGLKDNKKLTETLIHRSDDGRIKIYLKDYTEFGNYQPIICRMPNINGNTVLTSFVVLENIWLGDHPDQISILRKNTDVNNTANNIDIYYIVKSTGKIYTISGKYRYDSSIDESAKQQPCVVSRKTDDKYLKIGFAIPTNDAGWNVRRTIQSVRPKPTENLIKTVPIKKKSILIRFADSVHTVFEVIDNTLAKLFKF